MKERLQKVIAEAGVCSRREAERLIALGEVSVNGSSVIRPGTCVDPAVDHVQVMGKRLRHAPPHIYVLLNKPRGCVTTLRDPEGRPTVRDMVAGVKARLFPVGRLDYNTEGLLLMTNDGALAYSLMRPGGVAKTYRVKVKGTPSPESLEKLKQGLALDGKPLLPVKARVESRGETAWLRVTIHEGRRNQIVRMMQAIGHPVRRLRRTGIGPLELGTIPSGQWRRLENEEIEELRRAARGETQAKPITPARTRTAGPDSPSRARDRARPMAVGRGAGVRSRMTRPPRQRSR